VLPSLLGLVFLKKIEALQRTLQNNQHLTDFEKTVLNHFKRLQNIQFSNQTYGLKKAKKDELLNFSFQKSPINYEEILLWCESHLQNKTIKEVFEAEAQKA